MRLLITWILGLVIIDLQKEIYLLITIAITINDQLSEFEFDCLLVKFHIIRMIDIVHSHYTRFIK